MALNRAVVLRQSGERSKMPIIIGVLLILCILGIGIAYSMMGSTGPQHTEETDAGSGGGGGGGGGSGYSDSSDSYRPAPIAPEETTTTTTTTMRPKLLMCTTRFPGPGHDPPKNMCDIVVYDANVTDLGNHPPYEVTLFKEYCKKKESACGLNIWNPYGVVDQLATPETKQVMRDLRAAGVKHYGLLNSSLTTTTAKDDLKVVVSVLQKLQTFMDVTGENRDKLFWGVTPTLDGKASPPNSMLQIFLDVLKSAAVNIVVYQTTIWKNFTTGDVGCVSTGPSMWKLSFFPAQPTFVDALNFRKAVRVQQLSGIGELLTITLCGYWAAYDADLPTGKFNLSSHCSGTYTYTVEPYACKGGALSSGYYSELDDSDNLVYRTKFTTGYRAIGGYEMNDTVIGKGCRAKADYGYDGGWLVHDLQCNFRQHCGGKEAGGFPRLRALKDAMSLNFPSC